MAKQNLAFRGHRAERISSLSKPEETISENIGNVLTRIRLLAKYDIILVEDLQRGKKMDIVQHG